MESSEASQVVLEEGEAHESDILLVPMEMAWAAVRAFDSVAKWAPRSVECCMVENAVDAEKIGCARRCAFRCETNVCPCPPTGVLRETLMAWRQGTSKCFMSYALTESLAKPPHALQGAAVGKTPHRAAGSPTPPFPVPVHEMLTTLTVAQLGSDPNKCYCELYSTFIVEGESAADSRAAAAKMHEFVLHQWLHPLLQELSEHVLSVAYPVAAIIDNAYRAEYKQYEDMYVQLATEHIRLRGECPAPVEADNSPTVRLIRATLDAYDKLLSSWTVLARDVSVLTAQRRILEGELAAARLITDAAGKLVAANSEAQVQFVKAAVDELSPKRASAAELMEAGTTQTSEPDVSVPTEVVPRPPTPPKYRVDPPKVDKALVRKAVMSGLIMSDDELRRVFEGLCGEGLDHLTKPDVQELLMTVEDFGLFHDSHVTLNPRRGEHVAYGRLPWRDT